MSAVLVVCHANVCRSPLAAAGLRRSRALAAAGVTSRGSHALIDAPMCLVSQSTGIDLGIPLPEEHAGRQLTVGSIGRSDLILTAERDQRAAVARLSPEARSRTFTLLEALALAEEVAAQNPPAFADVAALATALNGARGISGPLKHLDVSDGHGLSRRRHRAATKGMAKASLAFAALADRLIGGEPATPALQ